MRDDHVAGLADRAGQVPDRLGHVALRDRHRVERFDHVLLERAPLRGAALALGLDRLQLLLLVAQALQLPLEPGQTLQQRLLGLVLTLVGLRAARGSCRP